VGRFGDLIEKTLNLGNNTIIDIGYRPQGSTFTFACVNAACKLALNKTIDDALQITPEDVVFELGGLPEDHHHCARLAVDTLEEAIASTFEEIA
jgi:nitrogen fixation NifU-like protein